jgi:hypothetical protein
LCGILVILIEYWKMHTCRCSISHCKPMVIYKHKWDMHLLHIVSIKPNILMLKYDITFIP